MHTVWKEWPRPCCCNGNAAAFRQFGLLLYLNSILIILCSFRQGLGRSVYLLLLLSWVFSRTTGCLGGCCWVWIQLVSKLTRVCKLGTLAKGSRLQSVRRITTPALSQMCRRSRILQRACTDHASSCSRGRISYPTLGNWVGGSPAGRALFWHFSKERHKAAWEEKAIWNCCILFAQQGVSKLSPLHSEGWGAHSVSKYSCYWARVSLPS